MTIGKKLEIQILELYILFQGTGQESTERSKGQLSLRHPVVAPEVEENHPDGENVMLNDGNTLVDELKVHKKIQRRCWSPQQVCRKPRRCWSKELHRRFVDALQQLGGSEGNHVFVIIWRDVF